MESLRKPETFLSLGLTVGVVVVGIYLYRRQNSTETHLDEIRSHTANTGIIVDRYKKDHEKLIGLVYGNSQLSKNNAEDLQEVFDTLEVYKNALREISEKNGVKIDLEARRRPRGNSTRNTTNSSAPAKKVSRKQPPPQIVQEDEEDEEDEEEEEVDEELLDQVRSNNRPKRR